MKNKLILLTFLIIVFNFFIFGNKLIKVPDSLKGLNSTYQWAKKSAKENKYIMYSVKILMNENSHYGSWYSDFEDRINLGELLTGKKSQFRKSGNITIKNLARRTLKYNKDRDKHRTSEKKVLKNVAIIFRYEKKYFQKFQFEHMTQ